MDGLKFCKNVYDMFSQTRSEPDGIRKLRSPKRKKPEKGLMEELGFGQQRNREQA
jgi:hypothetical protein